MFEQIFLYVLTDDTLKVCCIVYLKSYCSVKTISIPSHLFNPKLLIVKLLLLVDRHDCNFLYNLDITGFEFRLFYFHRFKKITIQLSCNFFLALTVILRLGIIFFFHFFKLIDFKFCLLFMYMFRESLISASNQ